MTEHSFEYEDRLLEECTQSSLAAFVNNNRPWEWEEEDQGGIENSNNSDNNAANDEWIIFDESCRRLFAQHAEHFGRQHSMEEARYVVEEVFEQGQSIHSYDIGRKLESFVRNVVFVHNHNQKVEQGILSHKISLNRFADVDLARFGKDSFTLDEHTHLSLRSSNKAGNQKASLRSRSSRALHDSASSSDADDKLAPLWNLTNTLTSNLHFGFNILTLRGNNNNEEGRDMENIIYLPMNQQKEFQAPWLANTRNEGTLVGIRRNPAYHKQGTSEFDADIPNQAGLYHLDANPHDGFQRYLNWATAENPDGVSIVNDAFDQGTCSSGWAFAAIGSLEASAARHAGYLSFDSYVKDHGGIYPSSASSSSSSNIRQEAIEYAQSEEAKTIQSLRLSVQEVVDCGISAARGCTGGNPLLAFDFMHRYGLTTSERYSYLGYDNPCRDEVVQQPFASVQSWGVLPPNSDSYMELALRFVGPIAVGFNGADPSFLSYSGGIFDKTDCDEYANHALLIVGYGEESVPGVGTTKYWIARNSWGTGWGENGFVRIARREGPGVCGIASNPSVALGGHLLEQVPQGSKAGLRPSEDDVGPASEGVIWLFLGLACFWLFAWGERRRRKFRRRRRQRLHRSELRLSTFPPSSRSPQHTTTTAPSFSTTTTSTNESNSSRDDESSPLLPTSEEKQHEQQQQHHQHLHHGTWYGTLSPRKRGMAARSDNLLAQLFPRHIGEALRDGRKVEPEFHKCVTVYFSDIVNYTTISSRLRPEKVSDLLDRLYTKFDALCDKYNAFKVETVGDAYMVVTNIASDQPNHAQIMAQFALDAVAAAEKTLVDTEDPSQGYLQIRVGFHSGPVVSNVVGNRNPRYSIIGDTVNTASRMESNSLPGCIHCSEASAMLLQQSSNKKFDVVCRGEVEIKGKGPMTTYWVRIPTPEKPKAKAKATVLHASDERYKDLTPTKRGIVARTESLLSELFPRHIGEALRDGKKVKPEFHECVTVYFSDIVGYTTISSELRPEKVSDLLDRLYTKFDALCDKHNAFKVETVGDAYMVVTNIASDQPNHVEVMAHFALDAVAAASGTLVDIDDPSRGYVQIRVGFHSGPVVSNVVGNRNPRYSIIGDTVNTASRMESNSLPGFIHCSEVSAKMLQASHLKDMDVVCRGEVNIKGKGLMTTYWVRPRATKGKYPPGLKQAVAAEGYGVSAASPKRFGLEMMGHGLASEKFVETSRAKALIITPNKKKELRPPLSECYRSSADSYRC